MYDIDDWKLVQIIVAFCLTFCLNQCQEGRYFCSFFGNHSGNQWSGWIHYFSLWGLCSGSSTSMPLSATISPVKVTNGRQALLKYTGRCSSAGVVMGDSVFLHLAEGLDGKLGKRKLVGVKVKKCVWSLYVRTSTWQCFTAENKLLSCCPFPTLPSPQPHPSPPSFGQLETEFIRFVLLLFSFPTAPFPPPFPSPPLCRNRICRNHSKARYNLLLAVHNTPSHSHPLSQSHKVPCGWTNHTWNIISASYSSILWTAPFYGAMDLTPAWPHIRTSLCRK